MDIGNAAMVIDWFGKMFDKYFLYGQKFLRVSQNRVGTFGGHIDQFGNRSRLVVSLH